MRLNTQISLILLIMIAMKMIKWNINVWFAVIIFRMNKLLFWCLAINIYFTRIAWCYGLSRNKFVQYVDLTSLKIHWKSKRISLKRSINKRKTINLCWHLSKRYLRMFKLHLNRIFMRELMILKMKRKRKVTVNENLETPS